MSGSLLTKTGALGFIMWGALHVVGGIAILLAFTGGMEQGFSVYQNSAGVYPPLAGQILGYFGYVIAVIGGIVAVIGVTMNWKNSPLGLALNTALAGLIDLGLIFFLVAPGHVSWLEASIGFVLLAIGAVAGGVACSAPSRSRSAASR